MRGVIVAFVVLLVLGGAAAGVVSLLADPGAASMTWLGWRVDMTAAAAVLLTLLAGMIAALLSRLLVWILEAPRRAARKRAEQRRKQGAAALARGFLAAAAGDGSEARRLAQKSADLIDDQPALVRVLAAQAAEAAGDTAAVKTAYGAMLGFPEMRLVGLRGLMQASLAEGDRPTALRYAQEAYDQAKTARWAWRALLDDRLEAGDWKAALALVDDAQSRKVVTPLVGERARAALSAALAASLEESDPNRAVELALQAAKLRPAFAPGVVMAARLSAASGKAARASGLIEAAWKTDPHPALWLAYRDLRTSETPRGRAQRLAALAALNPEARESQILQVEQALILGDGPAAAAAAQPLRSQPLTARLAGLLARVARIEGRPDEARAFIAQAAAAPQEPDWSDLDPEGRAFNYAPADWARLVSSYAETGELIHPRLERGERTISGLPDIPVSYVESAPFVRAAVVGAGVFPPPDDPGVDEPDLPAPAQPPAKRGRGKRLARAGK